MINFIPDDWAFERSSGYAGYRNTKTSEWLYANVYLNRLDMWTRHTTGNYFDDKTPRFNIHDMYEAYIKGIKQGQTPTTETFETWLQEYEQKNYFV